jgi:hypothetical protein
MSSNKFIPSMALGVCVALLAACASQPTAEAPVAAAAVAPAAGKPAAAAQTEADTAAGLEKKFQDAARGYKVVQKDGQTLYCKREKVIGSTIPTLQCITEAQLRNQVENMDEYRDRARNSSRCTLGAGCGSGG